MDTSENEIMCCYAHKDQDLVWSPDGTEIASAGKDKTVQVWNAKNGSMRRRRSPYGYALHVRRLWVGEWSYVSSFDYFRLRFFFRLAFAILAFCLL